MNERTLGAGAVVAILIALGALLLGSSRTEEIGKTEHKGLVRSSEERTGDLLGRRPTTESNVPRLPVRTIGEAGQPDVESGHFNTPLVPERDAGTHYRDMGLQKLIFSLIDECYEIARNRNPTLKGHLEMAIRIQTDEDIGGLIASADLNSEYTTIEDKEFLECASENVFAADALLERLRGSGDSDEELRIDFTKDYPTTFEYSGDPWPESDASPKCPKGATAHGTTGRQQWCQDAQGKRHGPAYTWVDGKVAIVEEWKHGEQVVMSRR